MWNTSSSFLFRDNPHLCKLVLLYLESPEAIRGFFSAAASLSRSKYDRYVLLGPSSAREDIDIHSRDFIDVVFIVFDETEVRYMRTKTNLVPY